MLDELYPALEDRTIKLRFTKIIKILEVEMAGKEKQNQNA